MPTEAFDDREMVDLVLRAAAQGSATSTAGEVIERLVAEPPGSAAGPAGDLLLDFVVGARAFT